MIERNLPCRNCITLTICRSIYTNKYNDYRNHLSFPSFESCSTQARFALIDRCKLVENWLEIDIRHMSYEGLHAELHKQMYIQENEND